MWLAVLGIGLLLLGAGLGVAVLDIARHILPGQFLDDVTLRFLGKIPQGIIVFGVGILLILGALWQLNRSSLGVTLSIVENQPGSVFVSRPTGRGLPSAVVFSGHMGLLVILNALRDSAGRLVAVPPPGSDFRNIGRLVRASHPDARVVSATAENAQLVARLTTGQLVVGASQIEHDLHEPIADVFLSSDGQSEAATDNWPLTQELDSAVSTAGLIIFGPGSFYTSVVPSLLATRLRDRIAASKAATVFVCNIMTEPGRTDGWTVSDFIENFRRFAGFAPTYTVVNRSYPGSNILNRYEVTKSYPIMVTPEEHIDSSKVVLGGRFPGSTTLSIGGSTVIEADIIEVIKENRLTIDPDFGQSSEQTVTVIRHDSEKLARVLRGIIAQGRSQLAG